jgi:hypothetical protein
MPWYTNPAFLGLVAGGIGAYQAGQSNRGTSSDSSGSREPWGPARQDLVDILGLGRDVFEDQRDFRPPPALRSGGGESRSALRELAQEAQRRAMESDFVPRAQEMALSLAGGNPLINRTWEMASQFRSPDPGRAMGHNSALQELLGNLMAGQTTLGQPPFGAGGLKPPPRLPPLGGGPPSLPAPPSGKPPGSALALLAQLRGSGGGVPSLPAPPNIPPISDPYIPDSVPKAMESRRFTAL